MPSELIIFYRVRLPVADELDVRTLDLVGDPVVEPVVDDV